MFIKCPVVFTLNTCIVLRLEWPTLQMEGTVNSYCKGVIYLFATSATGNFVRQMDSDMMQATQQLNISSTKCAKVLRIQNKVARCDIVHDDYVPKGIFIAGLQWYIRNMTMADNCTRRKAFKCMSVHQTQPNKWIIYRFTKFQWAPTH